MADNNLNEVDIRGILNTLPHRYPFLLIDKIVEIDGQKSAVAIKNVTINEPFFQGHFPEFPVMPGVLIVEAMAQTGAVMALRAPANQGKLVFFAGIDKVRFRKPVVPGDQLRIEAVTIWVKGPIGKMKAVAKVNDDVVASGELLFSVVDRSGGEAEIHPTATVHPSAKIEKSVKIGPYVVIGPEVEIGKGTKIGSHSVVHKWTRIGEDNVIHDNVAIGAPPQDIKYKGEKNQIVIGNKNIIREFVTIHLPSGEGKETIIGDENFIMVYAHIPHNCVVGNQVIIGGYVGIGGHSIFEDQCVIGGMATIHQCVRIGRLAMVGAHSKVTKDVLPFTLVDGAPAEVKGLNSIGMERRGISNASLTEVKKAFKLLYRSKMNFAQATDEIKKKLKKVDEVNHVVRFLEDGTKRGIGRKVNTDILVEDYILPEIPEIGI